MFTLTQIFQYQKENNISDIHLLTNESPYARNHKGEIVPFSEEKVNTEMIAEFIQSLCSQEDQEFLKKAGNLDLAKEISGIGRFRINIFSERRGFGMNFRIIPDRDLSISQFEVPPEVLTPVLGRSGLILISGPNNSGKTTLLNSFINLINESKKVKIITFEDPIEYIHQDKNSLICQHEITKEHKENLRNDLKSVFRQDANVVCIGEIRDADMLNIALEMCESGYLVMGTIHGIDTVQTLERIANFFPAENRTQLQKQLASQLKLILCQHLIPGTDHNLARSREILIVTDAMKNLINTGTFEDIYRQLETDGKFGNILFDQYLSRLYKEGKISKDTLYEYCHNSSYIHNIAS